MRKKSRIHNKKNDTYQITLTHLSLSLALSTTSFSTPSLYYENDELWFPGQSGSSFQLTGAFNESGSFELFMIACSLTPGDFVANSMTLDIYSGGIFFL